ncbi:MAG: hypothetical protein AAF927_10245 [Bacteroidota bacterium]
MKNVCLYLIFSLFISFPLYSMAGVNRLVNPPDSSLASLFVLDEAAVYQSVEELTQLEQYLSTQPEVSLSQLQASGDPMIADIQFSSDHSLNLTEPPLGIPSFIWGFCLGFIGMAVVYFVTEDREEVMSALYGCLVAGAISAILQAIAILYQQ